MGEITIERVREYVGAGRSGHEPVFLVDRIWPRGIRKTALELDGWVKEVAPSTELRKWFGHDPAKWAEFRTRYLAELEENRAATEPLVDAARGAGVLLLFDAKDPERNQAVVLAEWLRGVDH